MSAELEIRELLPRRLRPPEWLLEEGKRLGCDQLHLDSGPDSSAG
jgi:hypothetical protein